MQLGGVIRAIREKAGFSQFELAEKIHMNQSDVSKFENNNKIPDAVTFFNIVQATAAPEVMVAFMLGVDGITIMQSVMQLLGGFITWIF